MKKGCFVDMIVQVLLFNCMFYMQFNDRLKMSIL